MKILSVRSKFGKEVVITVVTNFEEAIKMMQVIGNVTHEELTIKLGKNTFVYAEDEDGKKINLINL